MSERWINGSSSDVAALVRPSCNLAAFQLKAGCGAGRNALVE